MVTTDKPIQVPVCARCGAALADFHCATCRSINAPIRGVIGEDMPGAEWTAEVFLGSTGDTRLQPKMRCAVTVTGEYGPHAWTQVPSDAWGAGQWVTQPSGCTSATIYKAWGAAMLARAQRAEWLIEEQAKRRQKA